MTASLLPWACCVRFCLSNSAGALDIFCGDVEKTDALLTGNDKTKPCFAIQCRYSSVMQDAPYWRAGWHEDGSGQFWRPCRGAIVVLVSGARRHGWGGKHAREGKRGSRHGVWVCQMLRVGRTLCLLVLHVLVSCAVEMRHYFIRFNS